MVDDPKLKLKGARVLIIEDNVLAAMLAEEMLAELGCTVAGTETSVEAALAAIDDKGPFDCVILDVRLGHELSSDIATYLIKKNVPFIICSGYDIKLPGMNIPVVDKPFTAEALGHALVNAMASASPIRT